MVLHLFPNKNGQEWFQSHQDLLLHTAELVSHRLAAQEELKQLNWENQVFRQELQELLAAMEDFILVVSADGRIEEISIGLAAKLQLKKHQMAGARAADVLSESCWGQIKSMAAKAQLDIELASSAPGQAFSAVVSPVMLNGLPHSYIIRLIEKKLPKQKKTAQVLCTFQQIKGTSDRLIEVIQRARRVSASDVTVLIRGESGTGKELFAQSIHMESLRADKPFVAINCAAIPENLLESELFGHVKGAFTGAVADKPGRFEMAHGGTLFLDEIGDMPLQLQVKLLRVVQERRIERLGDRSSRHVDVRIIAATHQNLEKLVADGLFREDLFYRLNVIPLLLPPLRERREDIPILIEGFMKKLAAELNRTPKRLSGEVYEALLAYAWPGNIRELLNVVQHFIELEAGEVVTIESLPSRIFTKQRQAPSSHVTVKTGDKPEREYMLQLLDELGRDTTGKKKVAAHLGISLPTLYRRLSKLKIK
ncbi:sigma-54 interaction domain-containing protein [Ectobacillus ponti]|uniref:Sigma 54-interacting transcriptional regulator n=1 Tax=Ectobacillus ponti TaxID=2961894 RepID=A0AA41X6Z5_9BACI|nr:sigma 54-interacting transcriptional regulator [Ectobacillus ponti]MCP8967985.1 sigma 54-interacting transcriptional regulator [Ectobacillus ponti]